jgi:hypothetical protein
LGEGYSDRRVFDEDGIEIGEIGIVKGWIRLAEMLV